MDNYSIKFTSKIKCCHGCEAPKRHLGCHDHCEEYKAEKELAKKKKAALIKSMPTTIYPSDFEQINSTLNRQRRKRRKK